MQRNNKKYFVIGFRRYKTEEEFKNKLIGHNLRNRHYTKTHGNIDWSKTHKNIVLQENRFKNLQELLEYARNNLGKGKRNLKKNASWGFEIIVDCTPDENWSEQDYIKYLQDAEKWFRNRFKDVLLLNSVIHLDEGKPHLHMVFSYFSPENGMWYQRKLKEKGIDRLPQLLRDFEKEVGKKYGLVKGDGKKLERIKREIQKNTKKIKVEERKLLFFKKTKEYKVLSPKATLKVLDKYKQELLEVADIKDLQDKLVQERKEKQKLQEENRQLQEQNKKLSEYQKKFLEVVNKIKQLEQELQRERQKNKQLAMELVETKAKLSKSPQKAKHVLKKQIEQKYRIDF